MKERVELNNTYPHKLWSVGMAQYEKYDEVRVKKTSMRNKCTLASTKTT